MIIYRVNSVKQYQIKNLSYFKQLLVSALVLLILVHNLSKSFFSPVYSVNNSVRFSNFWQHEIKIIKQLSIS